MWLARRIFESIMRFQGCLFSILKTGDDGMWRDNQVKLGEEEAESRSFIERNFWKASQKWHWNNADKNAWFSDSSYRVTIQRPLQIKVKIVKTVSHSILDLGWCNEGYLLLIGSDLGIFFIAYSFMQWGSHWLLDWRKQLTPAFSCSLVLNLSCLRAGT